MERAWNQRGGLTTAVLVPDRGSGHNEPMTTDAPIPNEEPAITDADLEAVDAAEAPDLAEALADQLEADLEDIATTSGGEG